MGMIRRLPRTERTVRYDPEKAEPNRVNSGGNSRKRPTNLLRNSYGYNARTVVPFTTIFVIFFKELSGTSGNKTRAGKYDSFIVTALPASASPDKRDS